MKLAERKSRLKTCEKVLSESMEQFVKVGLALKEIRDERLYEEEGFTAFETYIAKRWEFGKAHAYRLIKAADLRVALPDQPSSIDDGSGWKETHVREFERVESTSRAKYVAKQAIAEAKREDIPVTATLIRKHVDAELGIDRTKQAKETKARNAKPPRLEDKLNDWADQIDSMATMLGSVSAKDLERFADAHPYSAKKLAKACEKLEKVLEVVWNRLP